MARLGARLIIQTALEAEVEVFLGRDRYQRRPPARGCPAGDPQRLLPGDDQDHGRAGDPGSGRSCAARPRRSPRGCSADGDQDQCAGVAGDRRVRARPVGPRRGEHPRRGAGPEAALSKSTVSRVCQAIGTSSTAWSGRPLAGVELEYLFLDASISGCTPGARAEPVLVAWGITTDGKPVFVALAPAGQRVHRRLG